MNVYTVTIHSEELEEPWQIHCEAASEISAIRDALDDYACENLAMVRRVEVEDYS